MPAYLARVPRTLPLDAPLPAQCLQAMPLLEAIEQRASSAGRRRSTRASSAGAPTATRCSGCSTPRPSTASSCRPPRTAHKGLSADDLEWMLEKVPAEVLILRPDPEDHRKLTAEGVAGHF